MNVEFYIGFDDGTWDTEIVKVPTEVCGDDPYAKGVEVGEWFVAKHTDLGNVVFAGIYSIPAEEES